MSEILFIRHAETNMAGTFCGHSDPELNARGHVQVAELIDRLREEKISVVYTSDLRRAHSTAKAIAEALGVECRVRAALREINFGRWEGLSWKEIEDLDESYAHRWIAGHPRLPAPDGENLRDFESRVLNEVDLLSREAANEGQGIAVVTHAGVIRAVLGILQGCSQEDAWEQTSPYCSVVRYNSAASSFAQIAEVES
jgi:alpha-ribazole phosphatase